MDEKKIFTELKKFILDFTSYLMTSAPKTLELRFPHASSSSHLPSILPSVAAANFWLVVAFKIINRQPFKAVVYFIFFLFRCSIRHPKRWDGVPPRAPCPVGLRSNTPPTASANYRVDCCLKSPNGGHLRPEPGAFLYFLCTLFRHSNRQNLQ
jgi:hypothetical protein